MAINNCFNQFYTLYTATDRLQTVKPRGLSSVLDAISAGLVVPLDVDREVVLAFELPLAR